MASPTPRCLASAYAPGTAGAEGLWGVEVDGDLVRASWAGRWDLKIIPSQSFKMVPGSLVSGSGVIGRVYGVNDHYEMVKADPADTSPVVIYVSGPGVTPGSLVDGLSGGNVYAVDLNRQFVCVNSAGVSTTIAGSPTMAAGSLVATNWSGILVFGVAESYSILYAQGLVSKSVSGATAVPGSLIDGGPTFGLLAVDQSTNVLNISPTLVPTPHNAATVGGIQPGSLVLQSVNKEIYGGANCVGDGWLWVPVRTVITHYS